jgi:outer membrane protein TolC
VFFPILAKKHSAFFMLRKVLFIGILCLGLSNIARAQDTVKVSLQQFIQKGFGHASQVDAEKQNVKLAKNRIKQIRGKRFIPSFTLDTQHGIIPGVKSNRKDLSPNEYYLDPHLKNDFTNYSVFTRVHLDLIQPIYTWGALRDAVKASKSAADAAAKKFQITKNKVKIRLYKLYESYLLSLELQDLLDNAEHTIKVVDKKLTKEKKSGKANLSEADLYQFKIFKSEFAIRSAKVKKNAHFVQRVWNYVLGAEGQTVYIPDGHFLDPVQNPIKSVDYYRAQAVSHRPEILALKSGIQAAKYGVKATKEKNFPKLFAGITGSFAYTPNRPRQSNPFIINKSNYATAAVGVGIHQNLDFLAIHNDVEKTKIKLQQVKSSKSAATDAIVLQVYQKYKQASISKIKIQKSYDALTKARRWVRLEEQKADLNNGDPKDLIDALKKELELKAQYKQAIFAFNKAMGELFESAELPLSSLKIGFTEQ